MDDLDARLDALFAGPPGEFVAARDGLAKELRAGGETEEAARVAGLRRPTRLAAELNRLAREQAGEVAAVIAAQGALADAQAALLDGSGGAQALGEAMEAEAAAVDALSGDPGVRAAVRAAARRPDEREELRRGRLSHDPEPDLGGGLTAAPPPPPRRRSPARRTRAAPEPPPGDPDDEVAARCRAKAARERHDAAVAEARTLAEAAAANAARAADGLEQARDAARSAAAARDAAAEVVAGLQEQLAQAQADGRAREQQARTAASALARAEAAAAEAGRLVAEADRVSEELAAREPPDT